MMRSSLHLRRVGLLGLAMLLPAILGGCANDEPRRITYATWKQADPVPQPQLSQIPIHHGVAFPATGDAITDTEREALAMFLRRNGIAPGARVTLMGALPSGANAAMLGARLAAVRTTLADLGYYSATLPPGTSDGTDLPPDAVVVTARVLAVAAVPCPGYNAPIQLDLEHRPVLSLGCANAVNFGLMLANPADLQGQAALAPADGAAVVPAIGRYRADQVWPDPPEDPAHVPFRLGTLAN